MVQAAWTALHTKGACLAALCRRGKKRTVIAVVHSMLVSAFQCCAVASPTRISEVTTSTSALDRQKLTGSHDNSIV